MGNGVSGDQGNLPSYGKRDVRTPSDRKQHDWSQLAEAPETDTLSSGGNPYKSHKNTPLHLSRFQRYAEESDLAGVILPTLGHRRVNSGGPLFPHEPQGRFVSRAPFIIITGKKLFIKVHHPI